MPTELRDPKCAAGMRSPHTGLVGNTLHVDTRRWVRYDSSIGAGIDSYYEYLLKVGMAAHNWGNAACLPVWLCLAWRQANAGKCVNSMQTWGQHLSSPR